MATNPGFGERLGQRLRERGYWPEGRPKPDIYRFVREHPHYENASALYRWLEGEVPRVPDFIQLITDLDTQAHWLLFGYHVPNPEPGMNIADYLSALIRDSRRRAKAEAGKRLKRKTPIRGGSAALEPRAVGGASVQAEQYHEQEEKSQQIRDIMSTTRRPLHVVRERRSCTHPWWAQGVHRHAA